MSEEKCKTELDSKSKSRSAILGKLGIALILLSGVFFFSMFAVPWLPVSGGVKALLVGVLFVCVQLSWWTGAALVGPAAISAMRSRFRMTKRDQENV